MSWGKMWRELGAGGGIKEESEERGYKRGERRGYKRERRGGIKGREEGV